MNKVTTKAIIFGLIIGIIDCILVFTLDPSTSYLKMTTILTFWVTVSLVVRTSSFGGSLGILKGILWSVILNVPWVAYIAATEPPEIAKEILPAFIVVALVYGAIIGWSNRKFNAGDELARDVSVGDSLPG